MEAEDEKKKKRRKGERYEEKASQNRRNNAACMPLTVYLYTSETALSIFLFIRGGKIALPIFITLLITLFLFSFFHTSHFRKKLHVVFIPAS